jgi:signal transduction histidine kinase
VTSNQRQVPDGASLSGSDVDEMVRRLAHSVRNPLAAIKSGVQLIQRLTQPVGEVAEYFASLLNQVERIDRIVGDMQRWAKLAPGMVTLVSVREAVERAVSVRRPEATKAGVATVVATGGETHVAADPLNLQVALGELLDNAVRYSPVGGSVLASWYEDGEGLVHINVDDEGAGIAEENLARLCQPFFSTSTQGTGLGLAMAEKVCRQAGGQLTWCNLPTGGSRFSVILQAQPRSPNEAER